MSAAASGALPGPLQGVRVVELASELGALCGKLLADLGADVVVVEPPGGHATRSYAPHDAASGQSLWWWHYNTSKRGVVLDVETAAGADAFRSLVASCDVVVEAEPPSRLRSLGIDHDVLRSVDPRLIWVSITPYGRSGSRADEPATDLTILAGGGPAWSCGYDDHSLPPVRGGGNQAMHMAGTFGAISALTALLHRDAGGSLGRGQHIDVNAYAAANVTTESATYEHIVAGKLVQRQTGRHAASVTTMPTQVQASDGKWVTTGLVPRQEHELRALTAWMTELGLVDRFEEFFFLELGVARGGVLISEIGVDAEATAIFGASRTATTFVASQLPAYEFFTGAQRRGIPVGIINSIEDVFADPQMIDRGFPTTVHHDDLGRDIVYPGAPFQLPRSPWRIARRAPLLGEHQADVLGS